MPPSVVIRDTSGTSSIEFSTARRQDHAFACRITLEVEGEWWSVELEQISPYVGHMLGFFEEIAAEAEGWEGAQEWTSEYHEIGIDARNEGRGVVTLEVCIRSADLLDCEKEATLEVSTTALARAVEHLRHFVGLSGGSRFRDRDSG